MVVWKWRWCWLCGSYDEELNEWVKKVRRMSGRVVVVVLVFVVDVLGLICGYALKSGCSFEIEKCFL